MACQELILKTLDSSNVRGTDLDKCQFQTSQIVVFSKTSYNFLFKILSELMQIPNCFIKLNDEAQPLSSADVKYFVKVKVPKHNQWT
uniref:Uncharacterized protein n=1 Tax=Arion vulgaris TaxID=1028688 RepID=A0A0B7A7Z6_9EUPU